MVSNVGFWDQRFALQWVRKYIDRFGGDATNVVAAGVGSGAGSIMHHLTGFGGEREPLFSPRRHGQPDLGHIPGRQHGRHGLERVRRYTGVSVEKADDLNKISSADLQDVSRAMVEESPRGRFTFGARAGRFICGFAATCCPPRRRGLAPGAGERGLLSGSADEAMADPA